MAETVSPPINFLDRWGVDGRDRSHIPPLSPLVAGLRAGQLLLSLLILILAAVSADNLGGADLDVYGMTFFAFAWTVLFLGYVCGTPIFLPEFYNIYIHAVAEIFTCIFWLASWALCASRSNNLLGFGTGGFFGGPSRLFLDTLKACAGLGALLWVLFITTLVLLVMHLIHTKYPDGFPPKAPAAPGVPVTQQQPMPVEMDRMAGMAPPMPVAQPGGQAMEQPVQMMNPAVYPEQTGMSVPPQPPMK